MAALATVTDLRQKFEGPDRLSELFHMVNRILPEDQSVRSVPPDTTAKNALGLMQEHGFSQLPVVEKNSVLGMFSYRAFALEVANSDPKLDVNSLPVEDFLEHDKPEYARLSDEFRGLISTLDEKDSVVVSGPEDLIAILTPMDVLRYLYSVANGFVLIEEIEVTLRALIREAVPDPETFSACVAMSLSSKYKDDKLPQCVEEMTFEEYIGLLRDGRNWQHFHPVFGSTRDRVRGKLEPIRDLRNDVFHFRRELSAEDHQQLSVCRDWLLRCSRKVNARREGVR
jgi:predicted transcriptional regulator